MTIAAQLGPPIKSIGEAKWFVITFVVVIETGTWNEIAKLEFLMTAAGNDVSYVVVLDMSLFFIVMERVYVVSFHCNVN